MKELIVTSLYTYYHSLALEHYQKYYIANIEYNKVSNNNQNYDFLSHNKEENDKYFSSWREKQKNAIISVVFEAMAVESFINYYIVMKYGNEIFNKEYYGKSIWFKYKDIFKRDYGVKFEDYKDEYELFSTLIEIRNNMVHSTPEVINLFNDDSQEFLNKMSNLFGGQVYNIFNSIDKIINTFDALNKLLK